MNKKKYKVWADSESDIQMPNGMLNTFASLEDANNVACILAHLHDGKPYRAIFHVDDEHDETIDTYENLI